MNNSNHLKLFFKYITLNILAMLGLSCYILADTFFVSKALGPNGLAALNLSIPIYSFINGAGLMLGIGGATKYSISKSQTNKIKSNNIFTQTILLGSFIALIFFIIGLFFSKNLTSILGADENIFNMSKIYLQVILLFSPMFILNNILVCFIRNDGSPKLSMIAMLIGSFSNIILDYIFMFSLNMGIFGAVIATGISPIISIIILSSFFIKDKNNFHLIKLNISKNIALPILSSGVPSLITEVSSGIVMIIFNKIIFNLEGNLGIASYSIIANISIIVMSIFTGLSQGIQPLISSYYGKNDKKAISKLLRYSFISLVSLSIIIYSFIFFKSSFIVNIFNNEKNIILQSIAENGLKIYFISCLFLGFNIIMSIYFTSLEYTRPAHIISLLRGFIIIIPLAYILSNSFGIFGTWITFPTTEFIVSIISFILYKKLKE